MCTFHVKLKKDSVRPISEQDPLTLFHAAIKSPKTDKGYTQTLRMFMCDVMDEVLHGTFEERVKKFVEIGRNDPDEMLGILVGLSGIMRERTKKDRKDAEYMNPSTIPNYFSPIKKLLNANDVSVNWKRVENTFPELDNVNETQGWTLKDKQCILDHAKNARDRAIILTLASSGVRRGGVLLRWGDLMPIYKVDGKMVNEEDMEGHVSGEPECVTVKVYRRTPEGYVTFVTPEAYRAIMEYAVEWEADVGRKPGDGDPIFKSNRKSLRGLTVGSITGIIRRTVLSAGVWEKHPDNPRLGKVPTSNGFRRSFNKTVKDTPSRESSSSVLMKVEFMMGHKGLLKLDPNYYKTNPLELADTYVNAVPNLTVSESERLRQADRRSDAVMPELNKQDGRIPLLEDMSQLECLKLLEGMVAYRRNRKFAGSVSPA